MSVLDKLFRIDQRAFKKIKKKAVKVLDYEEEMKKLSDEELKAKTQYFKDQIQKFREVPSTWFSNCGFAFPQSTFTT